VRPIGPDKMLSKMIADGEIDALHTARAPSTFYSRPEAVKRLFPDFVAVEREYYRRTKIFPIMHVVAIRREVYEQNLWIAMSLYKAFVESQRRTYRSLRETAAHKMMLPWLTAHVEDAIRELGEDWWSYGFHANRHVLDTFLRYHHEQGLSKRRLQPEEMFAPETMEAFKI
jgi:4,5-dihydroxyphthalate decarboxylase